MRIELARVCHPLAVPSPDVMTPDRPHKPRKAKSHKAKPQAPPWRDKAQLIADSMLATPWEGNFAGYLLSHWHGELTPKQAATLEKAWLKCGGQQERAA